MRRLLVPLLLINAAALAEPLPITNPEDVGISADRLQRVGSLVKTHIDSRDFAGAVTLVAREGKVVHLEAQGLRSLEDSQPLTTATIFPLASMTKPITAVAVLMLMEEGKLLLGDPVSRYIPEYRSQMVAEWNLPNHPRGAGRQLIPAYREITLQDLLTHTSGMASSNDGPAGSDYAALNLPSDASMDQQVRAWAGVPLNFQPGTQWQYTGPVGFGVLGRIVELVSGMPLDRFFETRIFGPLGMENTFYQVPPERQDETAVLYTNSAGNLVRAAAAPVSVGGGGGLWSTAGDYFMFAQMLLDEGAYNGVRLLSPKSVELMSDNAIGELDLRNYIGTEHNLAGYGFGLGVRVRTSSGESGWLGSPGDYGWAGANGTYFWIDPVEETIGIILMSTRVQRLRAEFPNVVYSAFDR